MPVSYPNPRSDIPTSIESPGHESLWLLHIPGNAGGSVRKAIRQFGGNHGPYHHQTARKVLQVFESARRKHLFAIIRDPVDRALKAWAWCSREKTWGPLVSGVEASVYSSLFAASNPSTFFESVDLSALSRFCHHFTPQVDYLDAPNVDLISFEALQDGLDYLVFQYGGSRIILPPEREHASGRPGSEVLSTLARSRILDFYAQDAELHRETSSKNFTAR